MARKNSRATVANYPYVRMRAFCSALIRNFTLLTILLIGLLTSWSGRPSSAATLPTGFAESFVAGGMLAPTAMAIAPDGRIFVCQQGGSLRVIKNGSLLTDPFVTISVDFNGERGLLGVAFDPNFATNNFVYVYYTPSTAPIHNRLSRFTANGDVAVPGSETIILELDNLSAGNIHNGGSPHFGPDGKLYLPVGNDVDSANSQTLSNMLGKVLRINPDGSIPTDNPFFNTAIGNNRAIWALGLRNPFTLSFQPGTGRLFINEVGQDAIEEIDEGIAGSNYGWPNCEGPCNPADPSFRNPIYWYPHSAGACSITGGTFYNPPNAQFPAQYVGTYFFADFCAGWIKNIDPTSPPGAGTAPDFATGISGLVDLKVSDDGSLYYLQRTGGGQLWRIQYTANQAATISQHPADQTVAEGQTATFTVSASGTPPLNYQWKKNNVDIVGANSASYTTLPTVIGDDGAQFTCFVSNSFGNTTSNPAILTVVPNQPPTATITQPTEGTLYNGGQTINFAGTGTDPEQGNLPASAFTWEVALHHGTHIHPFIPPFGGQTSGSFVIPDAGHTESNVWYRINLTVTDSGGMTHSVFRDVLPRTVTLTLDSNPAGFQLTLDGQPVTAPYSLTAVVGIRRSIGVISSQNVGGTNYTFTSWSDGGAATHTIVTPSVSTTYTATFTSGLMFYPLPQPVRLLDTRSGENACDMPGQPVAGGTERTQLARRTCGSVTIPANALAITGNVTPVPGNAGFLTLFPSNAARPLVANSNFNTGEIVNNVFTVGLGSDGAFKIYASSTTHVVVDVSGYYAPPGAGGLYFHPLPQPVRLLETRPGEPGCDMAGAPINGGTVRTQQGRVSCGAVTITNMAQALVGNATVIVPSTPGYLTLFPSNAAQPLVANGNYSGGDVVNTPFTVGLGADGAFNIFTVATTHLAVDVLGYYSAEANDANGAGLLFYPLSTPVRLLETRAGEPGCTNPGLPLSAGVEYVQQAQGTCGGETIPASAMGVVGNATVVNAEVGFLTLWPSNATRPLVANSNFNAGQVVNRHFIVGLGPGGAFRMFSPGTTDLVIDLSGYFAP